MKEEKRVWAYEIDRSLLDKKKTTDRHKSPKARINEQVTLRLHPKMRKHFNKEQEELGLTAGKMIQLIVLKHYGMRVEDIE